MEYWGSKAADIKGSNNLIGIKNPVVDSLIKGLVNAQTKEDYIAHIKALDRVLKNENYLIFQWYSPYDRIAYQNKFGQPPADKKIGFQPYLWWIKEK